MASATQIAFEDLPNEILLVIFRYLKPIDLLYIRNLNRRLYNVIQSMQIGTPVRSGDKRRSMAANVYSQRRPWILHCMIMI